TRRSSDLVLSVSLFFVLYFQLDQLLKIFLLILSDQTVPYLLDLWTLESPHLLVAFVLLLLNPYLSFLYLSIPLNFSLQFLAFLKQKHSLVKLTRPTTTQQHCMLTFSYVLLYTCSLRCSFYLSVHSYKC